MGDSFEDARYRNASADATITVTVKDGSYPVTNLTGRIWLETEDGGLLPCPNGTIPDSETSTTGVYTWAAPIRAGGGSTYDPSINTPKIEITYVKIEGQDRVACPTPVIFNSGDLNGDLMVGIQDVVIFKPLYLDGILGIYNYSIDYHFDRAINLSDLVRFAGTSNTACD